MYHQFNIQQFYTPQTVYLCFVWISEKTVSVALYSLNWMVL